MYKPSGDHQLVFLKASDTGGRLSLYDQRGYGGDGAKISIGASQRAYDGEGNITNNGGGYVSNAKDFADAFTDTKKVGYLEYYKSGIGSADFSGPIKHYIEPKGKKWDKPIVIITNRKCYSSTSFFTTMMKELPNVTVLGDDTGGGAGLPVDFTLPNGWYLRYSTTRATNPEGVDFELGVKADEYLNLDEVGALNGKDNIIERAKEIIDSKT